MKKIPYLSELKTEVIDQFKNFQDLMGQVSQLNDRIAKMNDKLGKFYEELEISEELSGDPAVKESAVIEFNHHMDMAADGGSVQPAENTSTGSPVRPVRHRPMTERRHSSELNPFTYKTSNIIHFPESVMVSAGNTKMNPCTSRKNKFLAHAPFLALPGMQLPPNILDYRHYLQRDGLILLAWDKRETETGDRYTAYWVTSTGIPRFYASKSLSSMDFPSVRPNHKSYAAEDGIEFYGQEAPFYIVHVAPDLMKSNPRHGELRKEHIELLKSLGSKIDFDYKFLLKTERKRKTPLRKPRNENHNQAGA